MKDEKEEKDSFRTGSYFIAGILAGLISIAVAKPAISSSNSQQPKIKPVNVITSVQSSEGMTDADFNQSGPELLENWQKWIIETILQKSKQKFVEMGFNSKDFRPKVTANSLYVIVAGKKLAVVKIKMAVDGEGAVRSVTIMGIKGKELYRISCIRTSDHDIPVWSGECGNEIHKIFGVRFQP